MNVLVTKYISRDTSCQRLPTCEIILPFITTTQTPRAQLYKQRKHFRILHLCTRSFLRMIYLMTFGHNHFSKESTTKESTIIKLFDISKVASYNFRKKLLNKKYSVRKLT